VERRAVAAASIVKEASSDDLHGMLYEGIARDFAWLMQSLLATSDKVKGCELIFPDTAFFRKGKPVIVIRSDPRDFCLMGVTQTKKLSLQSIYKDFQNVVRRRRKDNLGPFNRLYFNNQHIIRGKPSVTPSDFGIGTSFNFKEMTGGLGGGGGSKEGSLKRSEGLLRKG
jgi:hypothetical protein